MREKGSSHGEQFTVLRKRKTQHKLKEESAKKAEDRKKAGNGERNNFLRMDQVLRDRRRHLNDKLRLVRLEKRNTKLIQPEKLKVYLVMRSKTIPDIPKECYTILQNFRLTKLNSAVFIKTTEDNLKLLNIIRPYVIFGEPSLTTIKTLIYKRGRILVEQKKTPLDNNTIVEEKLGDKGLLCLEDLIHEISTLGENFETVANFLEPFEFQIPKNNPSIKHLSKGVVDKISDHEKSKFINSFIKKLN